MLSGRDGGGLWNTSGRRVHPISAFDRHTRRQKRKRVLIEEAALSKQFTKLTGGSKEIFARNIKLRPQKLPGKTPKLSGRFRVDKGSAFRAQIKRDHLSVDFVHSDIGVERRASSELDLSNLGPAYVRALAHAGLNRMHGQREEIQKAFVTMGRQKTGKGLQKLMMDDTVVSDILHRVFNAPMTLHTKDNKAFRCAPQAGRHTKYCDDPHQRMAKMLDYALGTIRVRDHYEQD